MKCDTRVVLGILLNFCLLVSGGFPNELHFDPDVNRNVTQLISSKGYAVEDHVVQTKDGYLLTMQHIPSTKKPHWESIGKKEVVILQHGLMSSSCDYVMNFPHQSLGFILADAGYDVWLGNVRGNTYSKRHIKLTPDMNAFWNYSFDEMAAYDLPDMIDYVLNATGQEQLSYIGHSQGTTMGFALLSTSPEYNKKVKIFIALAPVATVGYLTSPIKYLASFTKDMEFVFRLLGVKDLLPSNAVTKFFSEVFCETELVYLCENLMFLMYGADKPQLNETRIGVYLAHTPAGTSTKSLVHYAQMVNSKKLCKYDYGKEGNMKKYNQTTPPEYDVSKITTPVALIWGLNDGVADPADVGLLEPKLKSLISSYCVKHPLFNHADFVIAVDANKLVYDQVLSLLRKYKERPFMRPPWAQFHKGRFDWDYSPLFDNIRNKYEFI